MQSKFLAAAAPLALSAFLLAPQAMADTAIMFPSREQTYWHPAEDDGIWRYRWTGARSLLWNGRWGPVASLQVRIPVVQEVTPEGVRLTNGEWITAAAVVWAMPFTLDAFSTSTLTWPAGSLGAVVVVVVVLVDVRLDGVVVVVVGVEPMALNWLITFWA